MSGKSKPRPRWEWQRMKNGKKFLTRVAYSGFVYIVRRTDDIWLCKIGLTTRDVTTRFNEMRKVYRHRHTDPFEIELVNAIQCSCAWCAEQQLHMKFREKHVLGSGDWFRLNDDDFTYLILLDHLDVCFSPSTHKDPLP